MYVRNEYRTQIKSKRRNKWVNSSGVMGMEKATSVLARQISENKKTRLVNVTEFGSLVVKI